MKITTERDSQDALCFFLLVMVIAVIWVGQTAGFHNPVSATLRLGSIAVGTYMGWMLERAFARPALAVAPLPASARRK